MESLLLHAKLPESLFHLDYISLPKMQEFGAQRSLKL